MWCSDGWTESEQADGWKGEPISWFDLIFGVGYFALEAEIDREIGPEYRMYLEMLGEQ